MALLVALSAALLGGIYPDGHFDVVTKCAKGMFEGYGEDILTHSVSNENKPCCGIGR